MRWGRASHVEMPNIPAPRLVDEPPAPREERLAAIRDAAERAARENTNTLLGQIVEEAWLGRRQPSAEQVWREREVAALEQIAEALGRIAGGSARTCSDG